MLTSCDCVHLQVVLNSDLPSYTEARRTDEPTARDKSNGGEQAEQAEPGMEKREKEKKTVKVGEEPVVANQAADEEEEQAELIFKL